MTWKNGLKNIYEDFKNEGINIGGTGKALRFIQTCKGRECRFGVINPNKIAEILEENIKIEKLKNKFKIFLVALKIFGYILKISLIESNSSSNSSIFPPWIVLYAK